MSKPLDRCAFDSPATFWRNTNVFWLTDWQ